MATDGRIDVLVIGAGASGAAVAWRLAGAGIGVVCLEQGDWVDARTYPHWQKARRTGSCIATPTGAPSRTCAGSLKTIRSTTRPP